MLATVYLLTLLASACVSLVVIEGSLCLCLFSETYDVDDHFYPKLIVTTSPRAPPSRLSTCAPNGGRGLVDR